ncbi:dTDP-4-amino-4,6-dideoxygalactose transaminase [bacterium]|nr:dTDP-4-amino-4,6-dideoxygalactose transaminase [bacterium]
MSLRIPFNKPYMTGKELYYIAKAHASLHLSGDGSFTKACNEWLQTLSGSPTVLLTHSCTAALEMSALLCDIKPGDEVIVPSFTFVTTVSSFVMRGAVPVFVEIRPDTLNMDEKQIEKSITKKTKAIVPVHYAGVGCNMSAIMKIARAHGLRVVEDNAQGVMSKYKGKPLGSFGDLAAVSFHETKNIISGEGGAIYINDPSLKEKAEIIREKGTNRARFFRGQVDKYTWEDLGSSYLPSEIIAAFLYAQMEEAEKITATRLKIWHRYHEAFADLEKKGKLRRPIVPKECKHNAHMYYLLLNSLKQRTKFIAKMREKEIGCVFHYLPLHDSPAGRKFGRFDQDLPITKKVSDTLVRLPLWVGLEKDGEQDYVIENVLKILG